MRSVSETSPGTPPEEPTYPPEQARVFDVLRETSVEAYNKKIKEIPILEDEQTRDLTVLVKDGNIAAERLKTKSDLSQEEKMELLARVSRGGQAKWQLAWFNLRFAAYLARRSMGTPKSRNSPAISGVTEHRASPLPLADRIQAANFALFDAIDKFDPDYKNEEGITPKFLSFARPVIENAILDEIYGDMAPVPVSIIKLGGVYRRTEERLTQDLQRTPEVSEVAKELELDEEDIRHLARSGALVTKLSLRRRSTPREEAEEVYSDQADDSDELERLAAKDLIWRALSLLDNPRQKQVLTLHYGLLGVEPMTFAEIGEFLGVSMQMVQQIEKMALHTMRRRLMNQTGTEFKPGSLVELKETLGF